jgi:alpha-tubulin suppressor-like RCC1 family protein
MKSPARASLYLSLFVAPLLGFLACWARAPADLLTEDGGTTDGGPNTETDALGVTDAATSDAAVGDAASVDAGDAAVDSSVPIPPSASTVIAAGVGFGCRIDSSGNVDCWGDNTYGQAGGSPTTTPVAHPQQVVGVSNAIAIALGDYHACAVTSADGGGVYCWGLNNANQLGHTSASNGDVICPGTVAGQTLTCNGTPTVVSGVTATSIGAAGAWTCAVQTDQTVHCWGAVQAVSATDSGSCGTGTLSTGGDCYPGPYAVTGVSGAKQLSVGFDHACTLGATGVVTCWGYNLEGQVAPTACPGSVCPPTAVSPVGPDAGTVTVTSVAVGADFTCALLGGDAGGAVTCFGDNTYGELGHAPGMLGDPSPDAGGTVYNATPTIVADLGAASELVAGGSKAACAIVAGGAVNCWGAITTTIPGIPVPVEGLPAMNALGVPDSNYACGLATGGAIWCWYLSDGGAPAQVQ